MPTKLFIFSISGFSPMTPMVNTPDLGEVNSIEQFKTSSVGGMNTISQFKTPDDFKTPEV